MRTLLVLALVAAACGHPPSPSSPPPDTLKGYGGQDPAPAPKVAPGLVGEYFDIGDEIEDFPDLAGRKPALRRVDATVDFAGTDGEFAASGLSDFFAIRWTGLLRVPADGTYTLALESDDGSKLWIDGALVVDNSGLHPMEQKSAEVALKKGDVGLRIDFFENGGDAGCRLLWAPKGGELEVVPADALFHTGEVKQDAAADPTPGLVAEYWSFDEALEDFPDLGGKPALRRIEKNIDYESTDEEFNGSGLADHFVVRWSGHVRVPADGKYTFHLVSDDGSKLWIGGKLVVDNGGLHGMEEQTGDVELAKGDHEIRVQLFENEGGVGCRLSWSTGGAEPTVIPASAFFHKGDAKAVAPAPPAPPTAAAPRRMGRILFLTHSAGFRHSVVTRKSADEPSHAERALVDACAGAFEVDCTQDCGAITAANLAKYQAVAFYTTGELPISEENRRALLDYVKGGGGFVGFHCATDTFYKVPEYGEMLGGYFDNHPWHQKVRVKVESPRHPSTAHLGDAFEITDEIYQFKSWSRNKMHVLMSLDVASVDLAAKGVNRKDKDFAVAWCKSFGRGRVFYTSLGHREEVWTDDRFRKHALGGIAWAAGEDVDDEGFTPLFDARHADGWKQCGPGSFKIEEGVATAEGGMGMWWHTKPLRNYVLKLEFQQNKEDANSGVFVLFPDPGNDPMSAVKKGYEIQIYNAAPAKNSMGAVYSAQAPTSIPAKKPGEWNEYEIVVIGRKLWVRLNGALINTYEGDRGESPSFVGVQNHGDPVKFRNIRVRELPESATAYHVLFEGDTKGWKMCGPGEFKLADGALTTVGGMGMLWHERELGDFILSLDWKVGRKNDNSGVFVRFPNPGDDPWVAVKQGYEIQICDVDPPKHRTGSVYSFQDATEVPTFDVGQWNHYEIMVVGQKYTIRVNGRVVNEFTGSRSMAGYVGLQNHDPATKVAFREIRVVELRR
jgi:type 1 glutamine amidotransferase